MKFRIIRKNNGKYYAQIKGWLFWSDMFAGGDTGVSDEFGSIEETETAIKEDFDLAVRLCSRDPGVVKEFEL